ncbi:50S ribosomal protein L24E [mine drainage metagenome]|uniref:50S ribosomal protein L24E n=2 Tax=mine drainage metagenome TaxID=410659 RepID=T1B5Y0_9ZZZZ
MVVKRQCSFCADEIEPGTGMMFVKRDGTVYNFCSGSCRKQQLHLGRVGHRRKWTRAHAQKKATEQTGGRAAQNRAAAKAAQNPEPTAPAPGAPAPELAEPAPEPATPETKPKTRRRPKAEAADADSASP